MSFIARWIFILCLPVLLLTGTIGWAANSLWLYESGFEKYEVSATTGLSEPELEKAARSLISYFNSNEEYADITLEKDGEPLTLFNREEIIHMKDVKGLFRLDYFVLFGTLVYILGYGAVCIFWHRRKYWRRLASVLVRGSGITLAIIIALWIGMLLNFDWLFLQFHFLSFTNEYWSAEGYMVMLFPYGFWYDTALLCVLVMAGLAVLLGGTAWSYLRITGRT